MQKLASMLASSVIFITLAYPFNVQADSLIYYQNGQYEKLSVDRMPEIIKIVDDLAKDIDDALKLIVMKDTIDELKNKKCLEVILSNDRKVKPNAFLKQGFTYSKFLIPFCDGELCSSGSVFYFGDEDYFTPPFINKRGGKYRDKIREIIGK